jgi:hypothetical protein
MNYRTKAILLVVIQCLLVSSIAAKYLYERATRPRVWVRVAQYAPNLPMRGRYLALSPLVDACSLPHDDESANKWQGYNTDGSRQQLERVNWQWRVRTAARDGKLVVEDARKVLPRSATQTIWLSGEQACDRAPLSPGVDFFIPDTAKSPFPLKRRQELWAEVTVPPAGPPRAIQLALSSKGEWKPLNLN